jgi:hypothetical protein
LTCTVTGVTPFFLFLGIEKIKKEEKYIDCIYTLILSLPLENPYRNSNGYPFGRDRCDSAGQGMFLGVTEGVTGRDGRV